MVDVPVGKAAFLATTGPGFFTRAIARWLREPLPSAWKRRFCGAVHGFPVLFVFCSPNVLSQHV